MNNLNFNTCILTIHDGKGKKDRSLPLPEMIIPDLLTQIDMVKRMHLQDLDNGFAGVFMFDSMEKNLNILAKNLIGSGFFRPGS
jgi:hypothetical protein